MTETEFLDALIIALSMNRPLPAEVRDRLLIAARLLKDGNETSWDSALSWFDQSAAERREARNAYLHRAAIKLRESGEEPRRIPRRIATDDLPADVREMVKAAAVHWRLPQTEKQLRNILQ